VWWGQWIFTDLIVGGRKLSLTRRKWTWRAHLKSFWASVVVQLAHFSWSALLSKRLLWVLSSCWLSVEMCSSFWLLDWAEISGVLRTILLWILPWQICFWEPLSSPFQQHLKSLGGESSVILIVHSQISSKIIFLLLNFGRYLVMSCIINE